MFREPGGAFKHPFLTPGSEQYADVLWDRDSWLSDVALRQILLEAGTDEDRRQALACERGCVLNYLDYGGMDGWVPIILRRDSPTRSALASSSCRPSSTATRATSGTRPRDSTTGSTMRRDLERFGALHEYYLPESGEPVLNRGFQNWNYLVLNMAAWYEGRPVVHEF